MIVHQLSRADARRIAVRAQLLDATRPADLLTTVRHLTLLQMDMTAAVAPNAELVGWSRLGSAYPQGVVGDALDSGALVEWKTMIRPVEDMVLYRAEMEAWPGAGELTDWQEHYERWVQANDGCRRDILYRLEVTGPVPARELPDTCEVPWKSTGWTNDRNVMKLLELMESRGEVAVAARQGRERLWDLAYRVYPDDPPVPLAEALHIRAQRRLRSLGVARPQDLGDAGEAAVIEGVRGKWRVDPSYLDGEFTGRTALLSPLDRLIFDRKRMAEIFEFDYQLEMYKPAAQRKWGYFALPILHGDQLVGKVDATSDRPAGILRVDAIHRDTRFGKKLEDAVRQELHDLADWLELDLKLPIAE